MPNVEAAGYIIHDTEGLIHGCGRDEKDAWYDFMLTMMHARIEVLEDGEESTGLGSSIHMSDITTQPATAALLQLVKDNGGNCSWGKVGRVACTVAEEEEAE